MSKLDRFNTGVSIDDTKDRSSNVKIEDLIDVYKFPSKKWSTVRLVGGVTSYAHFWFPITTRENKQTSIPKLALSWDPAQQTLDSTIQDPYRDLAARVEKARLSPYIYANAIIRELQNAEPAKKAPFTSAEKEDLYKEKDSDSWTPVRVLRLPAGLALKIKNLGKLNTHPDKDGVQVSHPISSMANGADIAIYFDKDLEPASQYQVNIRNPNALTDLETDYLIYKLDGLLKPDSIEEANRQVKQLEVSTGLKSRAAPSGGSGGYQDETDSDGYSSRSTTKSAQPAQKEFSMDDAPAKRGGDAEPEAALFRPKAATPPEKKADDEYSFD